MEMSSTRAASSDDGHGLHKLMGVLSKPPNLSKKQTNDGGTARLNMRDSGRQLSHKHFTLIVTADVQMVKVLDMFMS